MAELGGQMSAWIGITFISILHAIVVVGGNSLDKFRAKGNVSDRDSSLKTNVNTPPESVSTIANNNVTSIAVG